MTNFEATGEIVGKYETQEWKLEVEVDLDEDFPTADAYLHVGSRWGDHSYITFAPETYGRNKDTAAYDAYQDTNIAIENLQELHAAISDAIIELKIARDELAKR